MISYSFIIPVKAINDYVRETVVHLTELNREDWEAFIVTDGDEHLDTTGERIQFLSSGPSGPAGKRDLAAARATGSILVFLDDDAYPNADLLDVLDDAFTGEQAAIGGPAITPPDATFFERVSGAVYGTRLGGGYVERYLPSGAVRPVTDWPSVNFSIRKSVFDSVGGFDCRFWPGEDTHLCDKLTASHHVILYNPAAIVWHHRRRTMFGHLNQVGSYGFHRGYFAKRFGRSSARFSYFLPSLLVLAIIASVVMIPAVGFTPLAVIAAIYLTAVVIAGASIVKFESPAVAVCATLLIPPSHMWYGLRFMAGLIKPGPLVSKLR